MTIHIESPIGPDDHILGEPSARVTLVEYGDFECPYCAQAYPIIKQVRARFGHDLRFVFRHAPQAHLHPHAQLAAEATEAAATQGQFWGLHDRLFERPTPLDWPRLVSEARDLGLDVPRFEADVQQHRHLDIVTRLERSGAHTVRSTPTFFLDDLRYEEGSDAETLGAAIERLVQRPRS
jgi:protein-disulfide isomerase